MKRCPQCGQLRKGAMLMTIRQLVKKHNTDLVFAILTPICGFFVGILVGILIGG